MRSDPQSHRIIHLLLQPNNLRWIILLASVLVFCAILYPGLADTKLNYQIGDVAARNIKASRDFLIEDRSATETNRADAAAGVLTVYDHDTELARRTATAVNQAFAEMRKILAEANEALAPPPISEEAAQLASGDQYSLPPHRTRDHHAPRAGCQFTNHPPARTATIDRSNHGGQTPDDRGAAGHQAR